MKSQMTLPSRRVHEPFILAAIGIALTAGFGYAALLAAAMALRVPLQPWWSWTVMAHGHAQLFGWMGLFILGVGLFFLPRLRNVKLQRPELAGPALLSFALGILLYSLALPALAFAMQGDEISPVSLLLRLVLFGSGLSEIAAMLLVAQMLVATMRSAQPLLPGAPAYPVMPFILLAISSFAAALVANLLLAAGIALGGTSFDAVSLDTAVIQLMLYGLAIPMAFVFAVRNLPLYLRLAAPPRQRLWHLAAAYTLALVLRLAAIAAGALELSTIANWLGGTGAIIASACILLFVWQLDLLHRRPPWTVDRAPNTRPDLDYLRKPTRKNYPDYGEFGRFELLIYSAFAWLVLTALMNLVRGGSLLLGIPSPIPLDAERHTLTVGFITLLIFGMAVRMLPGFSGKKRIASTRLVLATFILGNLAALFRVVPLMLPSSDLTMALFGISGAIGWIAVAALGVNLCKTWQL